MPPSRRRPSRTGFPTWQPLPWLVWRVEALRTIAAHKAKEDAAFEKSVERYIRWARVQPAEAFLKPAYPGASDVKVGYPAKDTFVESSP